MKPTAAQSFPLICLSFRALAFRNVDNQTIELVRHLDLTGQSEVGRRRKRIEHILFHCSGGPTRSVHWSVHHRRDRSRRRRRRRIRIDAGMELRTAFSITVEPLLTSRSWDVPSKATIVSLVISKDPGRCLRILLNT